MFLPAAVLLLAGLLIGSIPALSSSCLHMAERFQNTTRYAAHILEGASIAPFVAKSQVAASHERATGLISALAASSFAGIFLVVTNLQELPKQISLPFALLHRIRSGHVGDYVTFLTLGMAFFGLLLIYFIR